MPKMTIYATQTALNTEIDRRTKADGVIQGTNTDPAVTLASLAARLTALEQPVVVVPPPPAPTGLTATPGNGFVSLSWVA